MEKRMDTTKIMEDRFPDGKIILLDGRVVDCYPRTENEQPPYTDKERKEEDKEKFIKNLSFADIADGLVNHIPSGKAKGQ